MATKYQTGARAVWRACKSLECQIATHIETIPFSAKIPTSHNSNDKPLPSLFCVWQCRSGDTTCIFLFTIIVQNLIKQPLIRPWQFYTRHVTVLRPNVCRLSASIHCLSIAELGKKFTRPFMISFDGTNDRMSVPYSARKTSCQLGGRGVCNMFACIEWPTEWKCESIWVM